MERRLRSSTDRLRAVVEVVPVGAGAHPVVVGGGVVGLVVGVGRGVVELAGLGLVAGGEKHSSRLAVKGGEEEEEEEKQKQEQEQGQEGVGGGAEGGEGGGGARAGPGPDTLY